MEAACDCLDLVFQLRTEHVCCLRQGPPLCINLLPQIRELLPLHLQDPMLDLTGVTGDSKQ